MTYHILKQESKVLQFILNKVDELKRLNLIFAKYLDVELAKHCQIIKYEKNCFVVMLDSGSWTTSLRFQIPTLLTELRKHPGLENLNGIICKTRPSSTKFETDQKRHANALSEATAAMILENAKEIQSPELQAILEKIGKRFVSSN